MNSDLTQIIAILDRSGSMQAVATDAIGGFNSFLKAQQDSGINARLSLVLFNHNIAFVERDKPIKDFPPLDHNTFHPLGMTALFDAIGESIHKVGNKLHETAEAERPGKVIVVILTDGFENASTEYTKTRINEMITHQREKYNWEFIFLAADQDAIGVGTGLGVYGGNCITTSNTAGGTRSAYAVVSSVINDYATATMSTNTPIGQSMNMQKLYDDAEKDAEEDPQNS